jgi:hypothetical protein
VAPRSSGGGAAPLVALLSPRLTVSRVERDE